MIHSVKVFGLVNKAEVDFFFFLELSCFFDDPTDVGNLISVRFQGKPFNITIIQVYAPEETEVVRFYEDLQDLVEVTPKKYVLFIIGDRNEKIGSQETPGVTGNFSLGIWNEAGQRLIEFCQENALVIANTLFQQHKRRLYTWTSPDGQHQNQIDYILCSQRWRSSYTVSKNKTRS